MIRDKVLLRAIKNIAIDYDNILNGNVVETDCRVTITEAQRTADTTFCDSLIKYVAKEHRERIYDSAMAMLREHDKCSFADGFLHALNLCTDEEESEG